MSDEPTDLQIESAAEERWWAEQEDDNDLVFLAGQIRKSQPAWWDLGEIADTIESLIERVRAAERKELGEVITDACLHVQERDAVEADLRARLEAAEKERDCAVEKWEAAKFDRNNAEKVEGLAAGLERDLRSERAKVELLAQRLDDMTLSRDRHRNRATALHDRITQLADEWATPSEFRGPANDATRADCAKELRALLASHPVKEGGQ